MSLSKEVTACNFLYLRILDRIWKGEEDIEKNHPSTSSGCVDEWFNIWQLR